MPSITEIRQKYPQYNDMSDDQLADALHRKFYSDMPRDQFNAKIGFAPQQPAEQPMAVPPPTTTQVDPDRMQRPVQGFARGAQMVGEGASNFLGFPVDAMTAVVVNPSIWATNKLAGTEIPLVKEPLGGSEGLKRGVRDLTESVTGQQAAVPGDSPSMAQDAADYVSTFGTEALMGGTALARRGLKTLFETAGQKLFRPSAVDVVAKPYGEAPLRGVTRDALGGAGSGALYAGSQNLPDEVRDRAGGAVGTGADLLATLMGNIGAQTTATVSEGLAKSAWGGLERALGLNKEMRIPVPTDGSWQRPLKRSADLAAEVVQREATRPESAPQTLRENFAELRPTFLDNLPTSGALAEDPGLVALEREIAMKGNRNEFIRRDQNLAAAARDTIDRIAPSNATSQPLIEAAQGEAAGRLADAQRRGDMATEVAQRQVDQARGQAAGVDMARRQEAAPIAPYNSVDAKTGASERLDRQVIENSLNPLDEQRRQLYADVPNVPADGAPVRQAVEDVRARTEGLPPNTAARVTPGGPLADFESFLIRNEDGDITGVRPVPFDTVNQMRAAISEEVAQARANNANPELLDNYRRLQQALNQMTENLPEAAEANRFYREEYAPVFGRESGEAYGFRQDVNKDRTSRTASPPSQTAGRFIQPGQPEKAAALQRIIDSMDNPEAAQAAVRDYLLSDLAQSGVLDQRAGVLRPDMLRNWQDRKWGQALDLAPGFRDEVRGMTQRAARGERLADGLTTDVRNAEQNLQRVARESGRSVAQVQSQIDKGALGLVMDADPDKTVAAIMNNKTRSGQMMDELIRLTDNNERARNGLKAAVRDYLTDKATNTANEKLPPGDNRGPVSFAKLSNIFGEHEAELARIFTPDEMNTLRAGHKALALANTERVRVTTGSDTKEKLAGNYLEQVMKTPLGKGIDAALRLKYGMLTGGGMVATARRYASGAGSKTASEAADLIKRAAFDPELMALLLERKLKIGPEWNNAVRKFLLADVAVKEAMPDEAGPPEPQR